MEPIVKILSGAALLTVVTCIARFGFASFISMRTWDDAFQAAVLFFFLRFGEHGRIAPTEAILGIILGAVVGSFSAMMRSWTATVVTIAAAMILIHNPCPSKAHKGPVIMHAAPSLGFWQLLLATFCFAYRSAADGGLRGCLCAAFTHIVMLASAAELLAVLSPTRIGQQGDDAATDDAAAAAAGPGPRESVRSLGPLAIPSNLPSGAVSPSAWGAGTAGSRHGCGSPLPGPSRRGSGGLHALLPLRSPTGGTQYRAAGPGAGAGGPGGPGGPRRRRRSSLPPFLEGDHELANHLRPPVAPRMGGEGPGDVGGPQISTRASCPVVPYGGSKAILRSASAAAVNAHPYSWNSGGAASVSAAASPAAAGRGGGGGAGAFPFAISASPIHCSAGWRQPRGSTGAPADWEAGATGRVAAEADTGEEEESLPDEASPDGHSSQEHPRQQEQQEESATQRQQKPWEGPRSGGGAAAVASTAGAVAAAVTLAEDVAADGCIVESGGLGGSSGDMQQSGSGGVDAGGDDCVTASAGAADGVLRQGCADGGGGPDGATDPRVGTVAAAAVAGEEQLRYRYRRETGKCTQDYILLASTTVPGTDGQPVYGDEFSSDHDDDEEEEEEEAHNDDDGDEEDDEEEEYDSDVYDDEDDLYDLDDIDGGVSDGCFSLVIDNNGAPLGDCMVGVNRAWRAGGGAHGLAGSATDPAAAAAAAAVAAWVDAGAAAAAAGLFVKGSAEGGDGAHTAGAGADGLWLEAEGDGADAIAAKPGHTVRQQCVGGLVRQPSSRARKSAGRHRRSGGGGVGPATAPWFGPQDRAAAAAAVAGAPVLDPHGCDVADLADFDDEDLMSLEEEAEMAEVAGATGGGQQDASAGGLGSTSAARLAEGLAPLAPQPRQYRSKGPANGLGCGGGGAGGAVVWTTQPGVGVVCKQPRQHHHRHHRHRHQQQQQQVQGRGDEEWGHVAGYVPLQAETLARHTAAVKEYELLLQRQADEQQQQSLSWQRADADGPAAQEAAAGSGMLLPSAAVTGASPLLLDSFLRDAALVAGAQQRSGDGGSDGFPEAEPPSCNDAAAAVAMADAGVAGGLHAHHHPLPRQAREPKSRRPTRRRRDVPQAHQWAEAQQLQQQQQSLPPLQQQPCVTAAAAALEQALPPQRRREAAAAGNSRSSRAARGRSRPHVRKLSAGQLLAREVISRYDQDHLHRNGNNACGSFAVSAQPAPPPEEYRHYQASDYHTGSAAAASCGQDFARGSWHQQHQHQLRGPLVNYEAAVGVPAAAAPLLSPQGAPWEDELLRTFELSGFGEPHLLPASPPPPPPQQQHHHHHPHEHGHGHADGAWSPQPGGPTASLAARVWGWLGPQGSPHGPAPEAAPQGGPCGWGGGGSVAAPAASDWFDAVSSSGGGWGGGGAATAATAAAVALLGSPQQVRCAPAAPASPGPAANASIAAAAAAASAPSTPPTTVVEPFSAAGQAVYRSLSGNRRYDEVDKASDRRHRSISDNYKAALAAAAAAGNRSGPATPVGASKPPQPPAAAPGAADAAVTSPLPHSVSMPSPGQAPALEREAALAGAAGGASGEARRRPPAVVVGGSVSRRELFPMESMPLSADPSIERHGGHDLVPMAAVMGPRASARAAVAAAAAQVSPAVAGATVEAVDVQAIADEAMQAEAEEVLAAASAATSMLSRLTLPSEVWSAAPCIGGGAAADAAASATGAASPYTRCSWAAASELEDEVVTQAGCGGGGGGECGEMGGGATR